MEGALPSSACMAANTHALGRYAALCQEQGLVPIVEPEVLMDGSHTIERCEEVSRGRKPTRMRWRRHRRVLMIRRIATTGGTTDRTWHHTEIDHT